MDVYALDLDKKHGVPREGALILDADFAKLRFDYKLFGTRSLGANLHLDPDEPRASVLLRAPGLSLSLGVESRALRRAPDFQLGGSLDWTEGDLWAHWAAGSGEEARRCADLASLAFGPLKQRREVRSCTLESPMLQEGAYPCVVTLIDVTTWRERAPSLTRHSFPAAEVRFLREVPIPGKGENAWDQGEDAISETYLPRVATVAEALAEAMGGVMKRRERHGGRRWSPEKPYAAPEAPEALPFDAAAHGVAVERIARLLLGSGVTSWRAYRAERPSARAGKPPAGPLGLLVLRTRSKPAEGVAERLGAELAQLARDVTGASSVLVALHVQENHALLGVSPEGAVAPLDAGLWPGPAGALAF